MPVPALSPQHLLHNMKGPYPDIQGGGSLILAWQIRNKRVLVVGGGEVGPMPWALRACKSIDG